MLTISDIRKGTIFQENGAPYEVIWTQHVQMGRGGAILRLKVKNLINGGVQEKTIKGNDKLQEADLTHEKVSFLYADDSYNFMNQETFDQIALGKDIMGDKGNFLTEGTIVKVVKSDGKAISIELPPKVELKVTSTVPGARGDTAQGKVTKPAELETGYEVQVPLFVKEGDMVRVNTETGEYVERVS
ncbi:elongation factor P [bacterium]|nr:elongation factor P [bacterium]|tara:strand:- start:1974 stop:2534 length:561 start_codon:yes stop_codon:yes gene_type:complete